MSIEKLHVLDNDIVSGSIYRKLIQDYKAYDKKQKDYIDELIRKIEYQKDLAASVEYRLKEEIEESETKYKELKQLVLESEKFGDLFIKIQNQKETIINLTSSLKKKKECIKILRQRIKELQNLLKSTKKVIPQEVLEEIDEENIEFEL